jgi:hypothetical protein
MASVPCPQTQRGLEKIEELSIALWSKAKLESNGQRKLQVETSSIKTERWFRWKRHEKQTSMNDSARGNQKKATVSKNKSHVVGKEGTFKHSNKIWLLCPGIGLLTFELLPESCCKKKEACISITYQSFLTSTGKWLRYAYLARSLLNPTGRL